MYCHIAGLCYVVVAHVLSTEATRPSLKPGGQGSAPSLKGREESGICSPTAVQHTAPPASLSRSPAQPHGLHPAVSTSGPLHVMFSLPAGLSLSSPLRLL